MCFTMKKLCEPCFPPSYKIFDYFIKTIHQILSEYIRQLLETNQLRGQEFFVLLSWQDTYKSTYFLGHPNLQLDTSKLPDILDEAMYTKALDGYLNYTMEKVTFWFQNALEKNYKEWLSNVEPYVIDDYFESKLPNDINTMLIQQVFAFYVWFQQFCLFISLQIFLFSLILSITLTTIVFREKFSTFCLNNLAFLSTA